MLRAARSSGVTRQSPDDVDIVLLRPRVRPQCTVAPERLRTTSATKGLSVELLLVSRESARRCTVSASEDASVRVLDTGANLIANTEGGH